MTAPLPLTPFDMAGQLNDVRQLLPHCSDALVVAALEQLGLNQRLAYSQSPAPNGDTHTPVEKQAGQPGPEASSPFSPASPPPAPKTTLRTDDPNAGKIEADAWVKEHAHSATVENLSPYLGDYNTLPRAAFEVWRSFGKPYPPTSTTRLQALRALTPEQLGQLLEACKK